MLDLAASKGGGGYIFEEAIPPKQIPCSQSVAEGVRAGHKLLRAQPGYRLPAAAPAAAATAAAAAAAAAAGFKPIKKNRERRPCYSTVSLKRFHQAGAHVLAICTRRRKSHTFLALSLDALLFILRVETHQQQQQQQQQQLQQHQHQHQQEEEEEEDRLCLWCIDRCTQKSPTLELESRVMENQYLAPYICAGVYFCFFVFSCSYLYVHSKRTAAAAAQPGLFPLGSMAEADGGGARSGSRRRSSRAVSAPGEPDVAAAAPGADAAAAAAADGSPVAAAAAEFGEDLSRRSGSSSPPVAPLRGPQAGAGQQPLDISCRSSKVLLQQRAPQQLYFSSEAVGCACLCRLAAAPAAAAAAVVLAAAAAASSKSGSTRAGAVAAAAAKGFRYSLSATAAATAIAAAAPRSATARAAKAAPARAAKAAATATAASAAAARAAVVLGESREAAGDAARDFKFQACVQMRAHAVAAFASAVAAASAVAVAAAAACLSLVVDDFEFRDLGFSS
ncbi:hypothetical protein ACSSS7_005999 [Eimeria intestinalis]